jgi:hypothetical protein
MQIRDIWGLGKFVVVCKQKNFGYAHVLCKLVFLVNTPTWKHSKNCPTTKDAVHESRLLELDPEVHAGGFETFKPLGGIIGQCSLFCGGGNSGRVDIKMQKLNN